MVLPVSKPMIIKRIKLLLSVKCYVRNMVKTPFSEEENYEKSSIINRLLLFSRMHHQKCKDSFKHFETLSKQKNKFEKCV